VDEEDFAHNREGFLRKCGSVAAKKTHVLLFLSLSLEHWLKVFRSFMEMMRENLISRQSSGKRSGIYRRETWKFFGSKTDMVLVFGIPWHRQEMRNDVK